ncbi:MAG: uracil-DNA glycosylase [Chitinispirillaceae bacterium]|nr:uracil-DNA glycosylase [Chitinispirillaceae bacterium]
MNSRELLGRYFRQQAELDMPDPFIDRSLLEPLTWKRVAEASSLSRVRDASGRQHAAASAPTLPRPPEPSRKPMDLKSRLSSLRPVGDLVASSPSTAEPLRRESDGTVSNKREALKELFVAGCAKCHLAQSRRKFVFGAGNAEAPVMIIGEAPGQDEDQQGLPFVGAAGKLLTTMLAAIGLDRSQDVFITNILKCHPPGNRNPETAEILTCIPLLYRQIDIIAPRAILLLGRIAAHALLDMTESIAKMRSRVLNYNDIPVMVIYHPAALLRNAQYKRPAWEDLQQFQTLLASMDIYGSLPKK